MAGSESKKTPQISAKSDMSHYELSTQLGKDLRRMNPYCRFFIENRAEIAASHPECKTCEVVKLASCIWNSMPPSEKQYYEHLVRGERIAILKAYQKYDLRPNIEKMVSRKLRIEQKLFAREKKEEADGGKFANVLFNSSFSNLESPEKTLKLIRKFIHEFGNGATFGLPAKRRRVQQSISCSSSESTESSSDESSSSADDDDRSMWNYNKLVTVAKNQTKSTKLEDDEELKALQLEDVWCDDSDMLSNFGDAFTEEFIILDNKLEEEYKKLKAKKSLLDKKLEEAMAELENDKQTLRLFRSTLTAADQEIDIAIVWTDFVYRSNIVAALRGLRNPNFPALPTVSNIIDYLRAARNVVRENKPEHIRFVNRFNCIMSNLDMPNLNFSFLNSD